jgi:integrase/recombinase XerD
VRRFHVLGNFVASLAGAPADDLTAVHEAIQRFGEWLTVEKGLAANTITNYGSDLKQFAEFLGSRPVREACKSDISSFMGKLFAGGLEPSSVARKISALQQFFRFLLLDRAIAKDPTANVPAPKGWKKVPNFLALADVDQFLDASRVIAYSSLSSSNPTYLFRRDQAMLELLYASGLRASEVARANVRFEPGSANTHRLRQRKKTVWWRSVKPQRVLLRNT